MRSFAAPAKNHRAASPTPRLHASNVTARSGRWSCCGAQNFCAAIRLSLKILTAATRSPRFFCHWQRSIRSLHRLATPTINNASVRAARAVAPAQFSHLFAFCFFSTKIHSAFPVDKTIQRCYNKLSLPLLHNDIEV